MSTENPSATSPSLTTSASRTLVLDQQHLHAVAPPRATPSASVPVILPTGRPEPDLSAWRGSVDPGRPAQVGLSDGCVERSTHEDRAGRRPVPRVHQRRRHLHRAAGRRARRRAATRSTCCGPRPTAGTTPTSTPGVRVHRLTSVSPAGPAADAGLHPVDRPPAGRAGAADRAPRRRARAVPPRPRAAPWSARPRAARGVPVLATNHFMPENLLHHVPVVRRFPRTAGRLAWRDLERVYAGADLITAPDPPGRRRCWPPRPRCRPAEVVSCGIDLDRFRRRAAPAGPRGAGRPVLFVGRLEQEKHVDELLRGFARLPADAAAPAWRSSAWAACARALEALARALGLGGSVALPRRGRRRRAAGRLRARRRLRHAGHRRAAEPRDPGGDGRRAAGRRRRRDGPAAPRAATASTAGSTRPGDVRALAVRPRAAARRPGAAGPARARQPCRRPDPRALRHAGDVRTATTPALAGRAPVRRIAPRARLALAS